MTTITTIVITLSILAAPAADAAAQKAVRVVVWDERQPKQKQMYKNFLGNHIAEYLRGQRGLAVRSVGMDDANQGLSEKLLDDCDVLVWWGHRRQGEISIETAQPIIDRVKAGKLSLVTLHSAHWSTPFMLAMHERARQDALAGLTPAERAKAKVEWVGDFERRPPKPDATLTPSASCEKQQDGSTLVRITRPNCCFPYVKGNGKPSKVKTLLPSHPIAKGVAKEFSIPHTEMYGEPFHVPAPDEVIFEERWEDGNWFRAGAVWNIGKGKVFYYRPGHENFDVFLQAESLTIISNAARWLAKDELPTIR
ncbi:MAG: ThuA domain-containing protein [Planctomycetota bacterium]|jgi:trehalose utilization protein